MRTHGIRAKTKKKFRVTTDSKHSLPVAENLAQRDFAVGIPNKLWLADITYIWTREGWLYLAAVLDAGTRKLIGWSMKERMTTDLVQDALEMAYNRQGQPKGECIILTAAANMRANSINSACNAMGWSAA